MRVLFLSFDEVPSFKGASAHILSGLRLAKQRHEVHLVTLGDTPLRLASGLRHHTVPIRESNLLARAMRFREAVSKRIRSIRPDVMHFRSPWEGLPAVRSGIPAIFEVNGLPSVELPYHYRGISAHVLETIQQWERECLQRAAAIICPSPRIRDFLLSIDPSAERRCHVLANGYDRVPSDFLKPAIPGGGSSRPLALVYLGTLSSWQGIHWALKAFAGLDERYTLDLFVSTQKRSSRQLLRRISRLGLGQTVKLRSPLSRPELLRVLPTYDFGFAPFLKTRRNVEQGCCPLKLLDYLAHGLPVLGSDLAVVRQFVTHGENGLLFPPNSIRLLRATLEELPAIADCIARLRVRAAESLAQHPTWEHYGEALDALYEQCRIKRDRIADSAPAPAELKIVPQ